MPAVMRDAPSRQAKRAPGARVQGRSRRTPPAPPQTKTTVPGPGIAPRAALAAACCVLAGGLALMLCTGGRAGALKAAVQSAAERRLGGVGFAVKAVEIEGATRFSAPYILQAAAVPHGAPILGLDLGQIRQRVEKVGWVKSVRILRLLPDTLVIAVAERPRLAVWQDAGRTRVVDPDGQVIPEADPGLFVDLPLIVGEGANQAAAAVLPQITARPRLMSRLEALVRVDGRRWDLRLKDGGLVQLPATGEDSALIELDQLDRKDRLFDLGFERIDLRDPELVAVRPRQAPSAATTQGTATPSAAVQSATTRSTAATPAVAPAQTPSPASPPAPPAVQGE